MTDFASFPKDDERPIVYVRAVRTADLPDAIQAQVPGLDQLYAIHAATGEVLALVPDRQQAFIVARQNAYAPVSVH